MSRLIATLLIVTALATLVSDAQRVCGQRGAGSATIAAAPAEWVRTVNGWERREALTVATRGAPPRLHPAVVAGFLAAASALVLAAFPGAKAD